MDARQSVLAQRCFTDKRSVHVTMTESEGVLFEEVITLPRERSQQLYMSLVGLEDTKAQLAKEAHVLLRPDDLKNWSKKYYNAVVPVVELLINRLPLFVFAGDVGTGKTALAETFGDEVSRELGIQITVHRLSLTARGIGAVGQMTTLLTSAFTEIQNLARDIAVRDGVSQGAVILVIDEADALAQSRELSQMHHEDRAGVNALIRGLDRLRDNALPVLVVMCTNRPEALDPAVLRRAASVFQFHRPDLGQRQHVLSTAMTGIGLSDEQVKAIAVATGESGDREYGCTYSDLVQRLLPDALLEAFPHAPLTFENILDFAQGFVPTAPFLGAAS